MLSRNKTLHNRIKKYGVSNLFHNLYPEYREIKFDDPEKAKEWENFKKQVRRVPEGSGLLKDPVLFLQVLKSLNISNEEYLQGKTLDKKAVELTNCEVEVNLSGMAEIKEDIRYLRRRATPRKRTPINESNIIKELRAMIIYNTYQSVQSFNWINSFSNIKTYEIATSYNAYGSPYNKEFNLFDINENLQNYYITMQFNGRHYYDYSNTYSYLFPKIHRQHDKFKALIPLEDCPILPLLVLFQRYIDPNKFTDLFGNNARIPLPLLAIDLIISAYFTCKYYNDYLKVLKQKNSSTGEISKAIMMLDRILEAIESFSYSNIDYNCLDGKRRIDISKIFYIGTLRVIGIILNVVSLKENALERFSKELIYQRQDPYFILFPHNLSFNISENSKIYESIRFLNSAEFPYYTKDNFPKDPNYIMSKLTVIQIPEELDEIIKKIDGFQQDLCLFLSQFTMNPRKTLPEEYNPFL